MSVETSNAPRELRVGVRPPVGKHQRVRLVDHGQTAAYMDEAIHEYVRRDLVIPTVDEIAGAVCNGLHGVGVQLDEATEHERGVIDNVSRAVRSLLLSRIEGDNEPTGDCETDCVERCRGECGDLAASGGESA